jgi:hypothetical protein
MQVRGLGEVPPLFISPSLKGYLPETSAGKAAIARHVEDRLYPFEHFDGFLGPGGHPSDDLSTRRNRSAPSGRKALSIPGLHQMPPYLLLHPILDVLKTPVGMTYPKVVNPTSEFGVDKSYHPLHRLRDKTSEYFLEIMQELCPRLHCRRVEHSPFALRVLTLWKSNPRKLKLCPFFRSTNRVFSSLMVSLRFANSSRSRRYTLSNLSESQGIKYLQGKKK